MTVSAVVAMIFLVLAWELWLAPMGGKPSWVVLKAFVLMLPLRGLLYGRRYTYQWYTMFVLLFFMEGVMRAWSDKGVSQLLAGVQVALTVISFVSATLYAKYSRPSLLQQVNSSNG
ncbi:DUF2069 domain-containing protein [Deefgea chitinilytica]|uniref:DUF2069 domain-containing protein n=2 Tax=Chitinibacteraceae TaxID=2897177 RepID=A0ABS2CFJ0_9NEIS|nr:DUF2069 domain-containing protein [Deefgea chitinilytica]MBM9890019.1 DUF2069 domain-containing protein [Deefgea sp. CFH1-16]